MFDDRINTNNIKPEVASPNNEPHKAMSLIEKLSDEQKSILTAVVDDKSNVAVPSKAGSGKTTLCLAMGYAFWQKHKRRTLLLTYSNQLKHETRAKIDELLLGDQLEAHSFHACAFHYFLKNNTSSTSSTSSTTLESEDAEDGMIYNAIRQKPAHPIEIGLVVVDEAQDMNQLYYQLVCHILTNCSQPPILVLLGDPFQSIYAFNGSNYDYLLCPQHYFGSFLASPTFRMIHLTICWRITHEMANFINQQLNPCTLQYVNPVWWEAHGDKIIALWGPGIRANPKRQPEPDSVDYVVGRDYRDPEILSSVKNMLSQYGLGNVAILSNTLKKNPFTQTFVERLGTSSDDNWAVLFNSEHYVPRTVFSSKYIASTIHKFKGLERDGVVVEFNASVERMSPNDPLNHYNLYYVACTRAKHKLLLIKGSGIEYATLRASALQPTQRHFQPCSVSKLIEFTQFNELLSVRDNLFQVTQEPQPFMEYKAVLLTPEIRMSLGRNHRTIEDVSQFLGVAVHYKIAITFDYPVRNIALQLLQSVSYDYRAMGNIVEELFKKPQHLWSWDELFHYAIIVESYDSNYTHWWRQIQSPLTQQQIDFLDNTVQNALVMLFDLAVRYRLVDPPKTPTNTILTNDEVEEEVDDDDDDPKSANESNKTAKQEIKQTATQMRHMLKPIVKCERDLFLNWKYPWFENQFKPYLLGRVDLWLGPLLVEIKISNQLRTDHLLQVQTYKSMWNLTNSTSQQSGEPRDCFLLIPNQAKLYKVQTRPDVLTTINNRDFEFIYRMTRRKMGLDVSVVDLQQDYENSPYSVSFF